MGSDWLGPILQIGGAIIGGSMGGPAGAAAGSQIGSATAGAIQGGFTPNTASAFAQPLGMLAGKGGSNASPFMQMPQMPQAPVMPLPQLTLGGGGGVPQIIPPQMQLPQMAGSAIPQIGGVTPAGLDFSSVPFAFQFQGGLPPLPQYSEVPQPQGVSMPELSQAQAAQFPGPQPPYAPAQQSDADEYTQLLNYIRMNSFQRPRG